MHFFRGFLMSVLPLTLAQNAVTPPDIEEEVTCLTFYPWAQRAFDWLDSNNNLNLELDEYLNGFHRLRGYTTEGDEITRQILIARHGDQGIDCPTAAALLRQYDTDNNSIITLWDFRRIYYTRLDINLDDRVNAETFIREIDRILTIAGVPFSFGN